MSATETAADSRYRGLKRPQKGERFGGRAVGTPNKWNGDIKAMVVEALKGAGGVDYLITQAHKNPVAFLGLVGRVLPLQVTAANGATMAWVIRGPEAVANTDEWLKLNAPDADTIEHETDAGTKVD